MLSKHNSMTRSTRLATSLCLALVLAVLLPLAAFWFGAGMQTAVRVIRALSWLLSAVLYFLHLIIENRSRPRATVAAWHTSAAVAMATLLLALVATARQLGAENRRPAVFVAIAVWPILTGLVSFAVGVVLSGLLARSIPPREGVT